jgi:SAM-dependent methyltransferase
MVKLKNAVKYQIGRIVSMLAPTVLKELETGVNPTKNTWLKKQIVDGRKALSTKKQNLKQLQSAHLLYWQSEQGAKFYRAFENRFDDWFLGEHKIFITELQKFMHSGREFKTILEIGCGDGQVLNYLSKNLPGVERGIGIDINGGIIQENTKTYSENMKLDFVAGEALEGIKANLDDNSLLISYGGVLEYFSGQSVKDIFEIIHETSNFSGIALVEPISPDHDLDTSFNSFIFGQENSFSHNHEYMLRETGFEIVFECEKHLDDRWKIIIAVSP